MLMYTLGDFWPDFFGPSLPELICIWTFYQNDCSRDKIDINNARIEAYKEAIEHLEAEIDKIDKKIAKLDDKLAAVNQQLAQVQQQQLALQQAIQQHGFKSLQIVQPQTIHNKMAQLQQQLNQLPAGAQ